MKKLKVMASMLCMSIIFTTPMTALAAQPVNVNLESVTPQALFNGVITANNVKLRNSSGTSIGQVHKGDTLTIDLEIAWKYFDGVKFRYVTMKSGNNKGKSGWVAASYIETRISSK